MKAIMVRVSLASLALAVGASPLAAQEAWRASSSNAVGDGFIDTASIKRNGSEIEFWREIRFKAVKTLSNGQQVNRIASLYNADCSTLSFQMTRIRMHLSSRLVSDAPIQEQAAVAKLGGTVIVDLRAACFNEWQK